MPLTKAEFERSALDMEKNRLLKLRVGGFQIGDLVVKVGGVTGGEHK